MVYDEEWARSVKESFGDSEEVEKVLQTHKKDVDSIKSQIGPALSSFLKDNLPLDHDENFKRYITPLNDTLNKNA